ncbi:MAG: hypothetical protein Pg6C_12060 [Treponemataceae bacterium]|nr:MAG: hypothetical protein Pg6C_12060 [Treponemataceae bacterium]
MKRFDEKSHLNTVAMGKAVGFLIGGFYLLFVVEFFRLGEIRNSLTYAVAGVVSLLDLVFFLNKPRLSVLSAPFVFFVYVSASLILKTFELLFAIYIIIFCVEGIYLRRKNIIFYFIVSNIIILALVISGKLLEYSKNHNNFFELYADWAFAMVASFFIYMLMSFASKKTKSASVINDAFETLLAMTPAMLILLDKENRVVFISDALAQFIHIDSADMAAGVPVLDLFNDIKTKMIIFDVIESDGYYKSIKQIISDGQLKHFSIIANRLSASPNALFIHMSDVTQIVDDRVKAESAVRAKNNFLANTSHEIRTPMNAILGMSELTLRENITDKAREYVRNIRHAGTNLLAIINDILDFSKMEAGKFDINPAQYAFSSLLNDCINIIKLRLAEKPILFIVNVDSHLPAMLIGDEVRVRQIILNLLTNAVKYTGQGHIILSVTAAWDSENSFHDNAFPSGGTKQAEERKLSLLVSVTDTGIGIKKEDLEKLFTEFTQVDTHKTRNIEGTGLGLVISRNLCRLMGGNISVQSVYGEGSTFYAVIPQFADGTASLAVVEKPETKPILVYEPRIEYANSIAYSLLTLNVPVYCPQTLEECENELITYYNNPAGLVPYAYAFVASQFSNKIIALIERHKLRTIPVTLTEIGEVDEVDRISLGMPAYTVSIANLLNGITVVDTREETPARFIAPDAHLLVVDDIAVNLNVAKGLLSVYQPHVDVCTHGQRAIDLVKKNYYDIVFMDHMMPEMDGIETMEAIRNLDVEYAKTIPIIAFTANAVFGMKEMFIEKGFNGYLSKPLEIAKLNAVMEKWIPKEKRVPTLQRIKQPDDAKSAEAQFVIEGIDTKLGIKMTGGTEKGYSDVLKQFCVDAEARFPVFASVPENSQLALFAAQAHALKSALAVIGASDVSKEAAQLEIAGKNGDTGVIQQTLPLFYEHLVRITGNIKSALAKKNAAPNAGKTVQSVKAASVPQLAQLKTALGEKNMRRVDRLISELEKSPFDEKTKGIIDAISDSVLMSNYDEAIQMIDDLLTMD